MPEQFVIPTPTKGPYTLGPDSHRQEGVPKGTVTKHQWQSEVFPGLSAAGLGSTWVQKP